MSTNEAPKDESARFAANRVRGRQGKKPKQSVSKKDYTVVLSRAEMLEVGTNCLATRDFMWLSLDLEWHESDHGAVTEIGLAFLDSSPEKPHFMPRIRCFHLLPDENYDKRNGKYVPDNRDYFAHGTTYRLPLKQCWSFLEKFIEQCIASKRPFYYVGHGLISDFLMLDANGLKLNPSVPTLDTEEMLKEMSLEGNSASLGNACSDFDVDASLFHNAGNDAYATLCLLINLCDEVVRKEFSLDNRIDEIGMMREAETQKKIMKKKQGQSKEDSVPDATNMNTDEDRQKEIREKKAEKKRKILKRLEERKSKIARGSAGYSEYATPESLLEKIMLSGSGV